MGKSHYLSSFLMGIYSPHSMCILKIVVCLCIWCVWTCVCHMCIYVFMFMSGGMHVRATGVLMEVREYNKGTSLCLEQGLLSSPARALHRLAALWASWGSPPVSLALEVLVLWTLPHQPYIGFWGSKLRRSCLHSWYMTHGAIFSTCICISFIFCRRRLRFHLQVTRPE